MYLRSGVRTAVFTAMALAAVSSTVLADTITKRNGQQVEGQIVSEDSNEVVIKTKFGTLTIPRSDISTIETGATSAQQFKKMWGDVDRDDSIALWELYEFCKDNRLSKDGRTVCERIIIVEPEHEAARRALGYVKSDDGWLTKKEFAAAERKRRADEKKARAAAKAAKTDKGSSKRTEIDLGDIDGDIEPFLEVIPDNEEEDTKTEESLEEFFAQKFSVATSTHFSLRAQLPREDVVKHLALGERILAKNNKVFGLPIDQKMWNGPYQIFHVKQKNTYIDLVDWIDESIVEMSPETKKFFKDGGGMLQAQVPLSAQFERDIPLERAMAHWVGQTWIFYYSRGAARSWLSEGFAMNTAILEFGTNELYCSTNTKYANKVEIADKNSDAAYQLVCLDIISGALEKPYPYNEMIQRDLNQLDFADLAKSWSLVDFFMHEHLDKFKQYIAALRTVQNEEDALKKAFGWSGEELDDHWAEYVKANYDATGR